VFSGTVAPEYQALFQSASAAWAAVLPSYIEGAPAGTLTITASFPAIDGVGKILGQVRGFAFFF
jgi:hypothetical protein